MGSVRVKLLGEQVHIWRTETRAKGKEVPVRGTLTIIKRGEKFSPELEVFKRPARNPQDRG